MTLQDRIGKEKIITFLDYVIIIQVWEIVFYEYDKSLFIVAVLICFLLCCMVMNTLYKF